MSLVFNRGNLSNEELIGLYKGILKPRMIEEKMLILLRQGKISKWFSGIGQEAISVGSTLAMHHDEYVLPMHRNLGVFTSRNMPLNRLFAQFQGKASGYTKGRDRSFHFGSKEENIVGMISHLGSQLGVADGIALGNVLKDNQKAVLAFTGDGATSQGDFHESLNVAAVWNLPVIFIIENNGYGLSTPSSEQFRCKQFIDKGIGYGMEAHQIDGNNIIDVFQKVSELRDSIAQFPRPILLECITFRMRGHEEASGVKYVPQELFDYWSQKDPVVNYENYLLASNVLDEGLVYEIREMIKQEIEQGLETAYAEEKIIANRAVELADLYAPFQLDAIAASDNKKEMRMIDSIANAIDLAMQKHFNLVLMGQDIAEYGGVFKATEGLVEKYGKSRVRNTPLCEAAIVGSALGLSINGHKSMMEMQFADFVTEGFNQIVNNLAKIHWRWGQNADVVVRMPTGAGVAAGPFHSQSNEAWFTHVPGLKVVYPSSPADAKGLLLTAFEDPNPVMFFEHKALYRSTHEDVSEDYYTIPFGVANLVCEGNRVSIITYGMGVHWAKKLVEAEGIDADVLDLRTLVPIDTESIYKSVRKTGKVLVLHEDNQFGGIGGEIASLINENCFESLDAPVKRLGSLDTPIPFINELEASYLASSELKACMDELLAY
ncbi:MAG: dehydrogenase [Bacteroidetes bacterium]|nr:MAG: dehydrogenase [Bacteroidota bacterium]MBL1144946.1 dehydrogenase [Bacteroidota bacterium]NOG57740.1 dehydrogenase [Bacteroidota bacterium]